MSTTLWLITLHLCPLIIITFQLCTFVNNQLCIYVKLLFNYCISTTVWLISLRLGQLKLITLYSICVTTVRMIHYFASVSTTINYFASVSTTINYYAFISTKISYYTSMSTTINYFASMSTTIITLRQCQLRLIT